MARYFTCYATYTYEVVADGKQLYKGKHRDIARCVYRQAKRSKKYDDLYFCKTTSVRETRVG